MFVFGVLGAYAGILFKKYNPYKVLPDDMDHSKLNKIDNICIVLFPTVFLLFNAIYWPICLSWIQLIPVIE